VFMQQLYRDQTEENPRFRVPVLSDAVCRFARRASVLIGFAHLNRPVCEIRRTTRSAETPTTTRGPEILWSSCHGLGTEVATAISVLHGRCATSVENQSEAVVPGSKVGV
jgi:hypothetical protein